MPRSLSLPVDVKEAEAVLSELVDALSHFPGEPPTIGKLAELIAPDAEIVVCRPDGHTDERLTRDAWLTELGTDAASHGRFLEEIERVTMTSPSEARVGALIDERWTFGEEVARRDELHCALDLVRIDDRPRIARLRIRQPARGA
jgi:hypothetical protein